MRRWQYVTDEGLILGYIAMTGPLPAEELVSRLGKKRTTLLPKLYMLRDEGKLERTSAQADWRTKPYGLTAMGRRDVERYRLADVVRAYLEDSAMVTPAKERLRPFEAVIPKIELSETLPEAVASSHRNLLGHVRKRRKSTRSKK